MPKPRLYDNMIYKMIRKSTITLIIVFLLAAGVYAQDNPAGNFSPIANSLLKGIEQIPALTKNDRVLIFAPHPDDETIGCAGIIQQAVKSGASVHVMYLTNGDHNELAFIVYKKRLVLFRSEFVAMGKVREEEARKAMKLLGLSDDNLTFLGYPDFGTFEMFRDYWGQKKPFMSLLTRVNKVPYKENLSYGADYYPENILNDVKRIIAKYQPTKIFVSHPSDVNYDHKTLYLFLEIALADLDGAGHPKVYPYLIHWKAWPSPRYYHPELTLLPPKDLRNSQAKWLRLELSPEEIENKYKAILCYKSQTESSAFYLLSFARKNELFGIFPDIEAAPINLNEQKIQANDTTTTLTELLRNFFVLPSKKEELNKRKKEKMFMAQLNCPVSYWTKDNSLLIRIDKKEESIKRFGTQINLFGYNNKTPFAQMPKIRIITSYNKVKVLDGKNVIKPQGISIDSTRSEMTLTVPLSVLGDPDFILAMVKDNSRVAFVDTSSFRKVIIKRE